MQQAAPKTLQRPHKQGFLCVGVVVAPHGVKGEVRIKPFTEDPQSLTAYGAPVDDQGHDVGLKDVRVHSRGGATILIARLEGVRTRNDAEAARGKGLFVPLEALPQLDEDEVYFAALVGMDLLDPEGVSLGTVQDVFDNGAHPVMVVEGEAGEALVPYTDDVVEKLDKESRTLHTTEMARQFFEL